VFTRGDAVTTHGLYSGKPAGYFGAARLDLLALLPAERPLRLLELGAGHGATLQAAKSSGLASYAVGVDLVAPSATGTPDGLVDEFVVADIEDPAFELPDRQFDAVLCADVLEHLVDPWSTVERAARVLRPGGWFVASIPNFRNHRALRRIVCHGDFDYQQAGLLDRSHLRFFCRRNAIALLTGAGFSIERVSENMGGYGFRHRMLDAFMLGLAHEFFVFQFLILARKQ